MANAAANARSREMRKALTPPEARLWASLKTLRSRGFHFRRQAPFRGYFLDFVCHSRRLVVEVDGAHHDLTAAHDMTRDVVLGREGYVVLRFPAIAIRDHLPDVMDGIVHALSLAQPHPRSAARSGPSPEGEGK